MDWLGREPVLVRNEDSLWRLFREASVVSFCAAYLCRFRYEDGSERAVANPLAVDDLGEDPDRWLVLVIGPDSVGNLLEIVVLIAGRADEIIIHAMPMRPKYRKLLQS